MDETFRKYRIGQKLTFLFSKCFNFLTPGGAVAFVYVCLRFQKSADSSTSTTGYSNFLGFSESLGQNTPYIQVSRWDLLYSSFYEPKHKQTCRTSTFVYFQAL